MGWGRHCQQWNTPPSQGEPPLWHSALCASRRSAHPNRLHHICHLLSSYHHLLSILFPSVNIAWVVKIIYTKKKSTSMFIFLKLWYLSPTKILISSSLKSLSSWGRWHLVSHAVISAFTGLPGAVLAHPLRLGGLARARGGKHRGVFNAQLYIKKPHGQYHTVIYGEGFLDRVTILGCINPNPRFICKRRGSRLFNIEDWQNVCIFLLWSDIHEICDFNHF